MSKHIVIIGGGYGGLRAIEFLTKDKNYTITLIDKNPYHYLQTEAYGYIAGRFEIHEIAIDLGQWCLGFDNKVKFINDYVHDVDFTQKSLTCHTQTINYDYLIIATGARTNFFSFIDGLRENSHGVKNLERVYSFRKEFEDLIYKQMQNAQYPKDTTINLAIGGAGLSGVEVAAEMSDVIQTYSKTIGERAKAIKIYLIDASSTILPGMSDFIIENTQKRLQSVGVEILTNSFINNVDDEYIYFKDGSKLNFHFMIFTGGIKATNLNSKIDTPKNKSNQFITDQFMRIQGQEDVFAIGDCVEVRTIDGDILPPTAQVAEKSAEYVAHAIKTFERNKAPKPFNCKMSGIFIALGGNYAVGEMFGFIKVKGYGAYLLKKAITYAYFLGLHLRINTGYKNRIKNSQGR